MSWFKRDKGDDDKLPTLNEKDRKVAPKVCGRSVRVAARSSGKRLETNWNVCTKCGAHSRIGAITRLNLLLDHGILPATIPTCAPATRSNS